jgi:hypothetical protein
MLLKGGLTNLVGRLLKDKALCAVRGSDNGASSKILVGLGMPIIIRVGWWGDAALMPCFSDALLSPTN